METAIATQLWKSRAIILTGALALLFLFCFWQIGRGRYEFISAGGERAFRGDRWTGEMVFVVADQGMPVNMPQ